MKEKVIAANFKMNKINSEIAGYFNVFLNNLNEFKNTVQKDPFADSEIIFAPPFTSLAETFRIISSYSGNISLASQNIYHENKGAYTGEISLDMIKSCGCAYAIVGHSERRNIFKEDDELISKKIKAIYCSENIVPILCVGENLKVREKGLQEDFVGKQLEKNLAPVREIVLDNPVPLVIAYEPVWAIGTGMPIKPEDGENMHKFIYKFIKSDFPEVDLRVIYGGSVTGANIETLMGMPHIDGVLVGGASLDPVSFSDICKSAVK